MELNPKLVKTLRRECTPGNELEITKNFDINILGKNYKGIKNRPQDIMQFLPCSLCLELLDGVFAKDQIVAEGKFADMLYGLYIGAQERFPMPKEKLQQLIVSGVHGLHQLGYLKYTDGTGIEIPTTELAIMTNPWIRYNLKLLDIFDYAPSIIV